MPEGDTVWRTADRLRAALQGQELTRSDIRVPRWATLDLSGLVVDDVVSRGKHLLVRVGDVSLHSHLKMEGVWRVLRRGERWARPAHTARIVLETQHHQAVGFSLGLLEVLQRAHDLEALDHLGPDLLGPDWDLEEASRRVAADPDRPVFTALLDQRSVAGFGNEYANELLFLSGLRPTRRVGDVPDIARVLARGQHLIETNKRRLARTFTGIDRRGERHWVYGRRHAACRRCGTTIEGGELGAAPGQERRTFWCPYCQM